VECAVHSWPALGTHQSARWLRLNRRAAGRMCTQSTSGWKRPRVQRFVLVDRALRQMISLSAFVTVEAVNVILVFNLAQ